MTYAQSGQLVGRERPEIEKAVAAAADVDCIVACIGENSYCETPGNLTDLTLSQNQSALVEALARTGKPIILILNEGRPRLVAKIEPLAKAVVDVMLPGNYGGDALANLLSGDANFSGKLPFTYPREINSLITYDYKPCEHIGKQMEGSIQLRCAGSRTVGIRLRSELHPIRIRQLPRRQEQLHGRRHADALPST